MINSVSADSAIRVFVAASPAEWLPYKVLAYSIRENSDQAVDVQWMADAGKSIPVPRDPYNRARTPFSFQRFLIPELCGYRGKAIYLDADMLVFQDILQLWEMPMGEYDLQTVNGQGVRRRPQFSVVLLDCDKLDWKIDEIISKLDSGELDYDALMYEMAMAKHIGFGIPSVWNSLESYVPYQTKLLHYTDMHTQPWIAPGHPFGGLWTDCLRRAIEVGFVTKDELLREIAAGHVRPGLEREVFGMASTLLDRLSDATFKPPYLSLLASKSRRLRSRGRQFFRALTCGGPGPATIRHGD